MKQLLIKTISLHAETSNKYTVPKFTEQLKLEEYKMKIKENNTQAFQIQEMIESITKELLMIDLWQ